MVQKFPCNSPLCSNAAALSVLIEFELNCEQLQYGIKYLKLFEYSLYWKLRGVLIFIVVKLLFSPSDLLMETESY